MVLCIEYGEAWQRRSLMTVERRRDAPHTTLSFPELRLLRLRVFDQPVWRISHNCMDRTGLALFKPREAVRMNQLCFWLGSSDTVFMAVEFFFESIASSAGSFEFRRHVQIQVRTDGRGRDLSKALLYGFAYLRYRSSGIVLGQICNYRVSDAARCARHRIAPNSSSIAKDVQTSNRPVGRTIPCSLFVPMSIATVVANTETTIDRRPIFSYIPQNLAPLQGRRAVTLSGGASAVPAGLGSSPWLPGGLGIISPALGPAREVHRWTGTGGGGESPPGKWLKRPSPRKHGLTPSLRRRKSLWREPWWNADRRARCA